MSTRLFPFILAALCAMCATSAQAQTAAAAATPGPTPTPLVLPTVPPSAGPYVGPAIQILQQVIRSQIDRSRNNSSGSVTYYRRYDMQILTGPNAYRTIHLHQGTVINPRGYSIKQGDNVAVSGVGQADGSLNADTITLQR